MEQIIKIDIPNGKKAVQNVDSNGNIVIKFEDAESIRSKTWYGFCINHPVVENEWYISSNGLITKHVTGYCNRDINVDKRLLETKEDAEGILALIQLTRLHDEWTSGCNFKYGWNASEKKYFIASEGYKTIAIDVCYAYTRLLVFPTREMAEEFLNCFRALINSAIKFI